MKNFILILLTFALMIMLVFFYQKSLNSGTDLALKALEVKKTVDNNSNDLKQTIEQINEAFGSLRETSRISKMLKENKQLIELVDNGEYFVYSNFDFKFDIYLDKKVFLNDKDKTFYITDGDNLILVFSGVFEQSDVNLSLLIDKSKAVCDKTNLENFIVNGNSFWCGPIETEEVTRYAGRCSIENNNVCLNFEYTVTNVVNKLDDKLKVENLILKNIVFPQALESND